MAKVFMADPSTGRCALYEEPVTTGDPTNPNSARNAPLNNPATNLQYLYFHSDYDPMEAFSAPSTVSISHDAIPAYSGSSGEFIPGQYYGNFTRDHLLLTHDLGYVPDFFVIRDSHTVFPGFPVQYTAAVGLARYVTPYATTTQIRLYEVGVQSSSILPAITVPYTVLVIRRPPSPTGNVLLDFSPGTGVVTMGRDKFNSSRRYLQVSSNPTAFGIPLGKTIDLNNGAFRAVSPGGAVNEPIPAYPTIRVGRLGVGGSVEGNPANYGGSFTGEPFIRTDVP